MRHPELVTIDVYEYLYIWNGFCLQAVQSVRKTRDPIDHVKMLLLEHGLAEEVELKEIEKQVRSSQGIGYKV